MIAKLIGIAVILAVGFMILRPRYSRVRSQDHGSDPGSDARDRRRPSDHGRRGGGCCG